MRVFAHFTLLLALTLGSPAYAAGALAIDTNHGSAYGYSFGYAQQSDADRRAVRQCGARLCHVVVQFRHACAAYAADQAAGSTAYGWGTQAPGVVGSTGESRAKRRALAECAARGGRNAHCIIRVWGCDP